MAMIYVIDPLRELPYLGGLGFDIHVQSYRTGETFDVYWKRCRAAMDAADLCLATSSVNGPGQFQIGWMVGRGKCVMLVKHSPTNGTCEFSRLGAMVVAASDVVPLLIKTVGQRK